MPPPTRPGQTGGEGVATRGPGQAVRALYQQGCPLRVMDSSMMSSATRKYAWSHSMHHPTAIARNSSFSVASFPSLALTARRPAEEENEHL